MALVGRLAEDVGHARGHPLGRVVGDPQLAGDLVGRDEADAVDVARQPVGVGLDDVDRIIAVLLVDLHGQASGHVVALQEQHHLFDLLLFGPGAGDAGHPFAANTQHLMQPLRRLLDDAEGVQFELAHDPVSRDRADPLDQAAAQVFLQAGDGGRQHGVDGFGLELAAILGVSDPHAAEGDRLADVDAQHVADHGDQVTLVFWHQLGNGVAVLFIVVGDPVDCSAKDVWRHVFAPAPILPEPAPCASRRSRPKGGRRFQCLARMLRLDTATWPRRGCHKGGLFLEDAWYNDSGWLWPVS